jgi:hypothetical protein
MYIYIYGDGEQEDVFPERLPIRQDEGIAEASAIGHGVEQGQVERERRHKHHKQAGKEGEEAAIHAQQQAYAQHKLQGAKAEGKQQGAPLELRQAEGVQVLFHLDCLPDRVYRLDKSRKGEDSANKEAAGIDKDEVQGRMYPQAGCYPPKGFCRQAGFYPQEVFCRLERLHSSLS